MKLQAPKGTKDLLPEDSYKWQYIERALRTIAGEYGCREIRTPMFESTELFERGVGETTDVVQKEMYTFLDKGNRSMTLKAEGTAPSVRAYIQHSLYAASQPTKMFYFTPVFRYENVQKGRFRQHHQFGVEVFGSSAPELDAEVISLAMSVFQNFNIDNLKLTINNIGCPECRSKYNEALIQYLKESYDDLCDTCKSRFEKNPMRILDCKNKNCKRIIKDAPVILDYVCEECENHFDKFKKTLEALDLAYEVDPHIVRGLDYYTKTVFEIINNDITVCGGGRYNGLIEEIGGPATPAVGFGMGIERLIMTLEENGHIIPKPAYLEFYIGSLGEKGKLYSLSLANKLRKKGVKCDIDYMSRSVKAQMKYANKIEALYTVIIGDNEIDENKITIKKMDDGSKYEFKLDDIDGIVAKIKNN